MTVGPFYELQRKSQIRPFVSVLIDLENGQEGFDQSSRIRRLI